MYISKEHASLTRLQTCLLSIVRFVNIILIIIANLLTTKMQFIRNNQYCVKNRQKLPTVCMLIVRLFHTIKLLHSNEPYFIQIKFLILLY